MTFTDEDLPLDYTALVEQDYDAAERWLSRAVDVGSDFTHLRLVQGYHEEALRLAQGELTAQQAKSNILGRWIATTWLGIVQAHLGDPVSAGSLLDDAIDFFRQHGLVFWLAGAQLHRAWLRRYDGPGAAHEALDEALTFGARVGALNYPFWHPDVISFACIETLRSQQHVSYIQDLARRRLNTIQFRAVQRALAHLSNSDQMSLSPMFSDEAVEAVWSPLPTDDHTSRTLHPSLDYLFDEGRLMRERAVMLMTQYHLTVREIEILALYLDPDVRGPWRRVNEAIAQKLALSEVTVRDKVSVILKKLQAPGRERLRLRTWAIQEGIIPP